MVRSDRNLDNVGFKSLSEIDQFSSDATFHAIKRAADVLHVLEQSSHRVVIVTDAGHEVLSLVQQLSHRETLIDHAVEYRLQTDSARESK